MKHLIAILGTLFIFALWVLPAFMMYHGGAREWSMLYIPIMIFTLVWGILMDKWYGND